MKKRDALMRGEQIKQKGRGRPRMTSSEKEAAREKRRQDMMNAVPLEKDDKETS